MLEAILGMFTPVRLLVLTLALSLTAFGAGLWGIAKGTRDAKQRSDLVIADMQLDAQRRVTEAMAAYRSLEQAMNTALREAQNARIKEQDSNRRVVAELARTRTERDGLRDQIAGYAAGGRNAASDTVGACRERAKTLGRLLDDGLRVQEELAAGAEACGADLRAVLKAWPVSAPELRQTVIAP
jgi:ribosomal protein S17E